MTLKDFFRIIRKRKEQMTVLEELFTRYGICERICPEKSCSGLESCKNESLKEKVLYEAERSNYMKYGNEQEESPPSDTEASLVQFD